MTALANDTVLITGAAVRIGRSIAWRFAQAGARVVVHYHRSSTAAAALIADLPEVGRAHVAVQADLADAAQRAALIPALCERGCTPDCLVNNASIYRRLPLLDVDGAALQRDYEINFIAPFLLMRDFARHCRRGCIINLLDQRVATVDPAAGAYALAKKSLRDATEAAAVEWAPDIRVNAVAPGFVLPPPGVPAEKMQRLLANIPMRRASALEEVADACLYLATAATVTGQILFVDGGLHLVSPTLKEGHAEPGRRTPGR